MAQRLPHCRGTLNQECDRVPAFVHPQDYSNRGTLSRMDFGLLMIFRHEYSCNTDSETQSPNVAGNPRTCDMHLLFSSCSETRSFSCVR